MMELIEEIRRQAASLPDAERRQVAAELMAVGEDLGGDEAWLSAEYRTEILRRADAVRAGRSTGRPANDVIADLRRERASPRS